ncbi:MAG TPA: ATP-binding protein [Candidatus Krumholzibacteria bacterium]|nr:ATP-binding protein [Candidatus Krumholzibacteria bacterium]
MSCRRFMGPAVLAGLSFMFPTAGNAAPVPDGPRRVLILHSFGQHFQPFADVATIFRTELAAHSAEPIDFVDVSLEGARLGDGIDDRPVGDYVRALAAQHPIDMVVAVGSPAFRFCLGYHDKYFPGVPVLGAGIDRRHMDGVDLGSHTTAVCVDIDLVQLLDGVLQVLPATRHVGVVIGNSPIEAYWAAELQRAWKPYGDRIDFDWYDGLTLTQIRERVAALPEHSAVVFTLLDVDGAGVPYEHNRALDAVHESSSAPVFGMFAPELGKGVVGGRLVDVQGVGEQSATTARRILDGESPDAIPPLTVPTLAPAYDWRELKRWGIDAALLPPGSDVRFRAPTALERYRGQVLLVAALVLIQALVIVLYATNRLRLKAARARLAASERSAQELRRELTHAGRVSLLGQFTASLAHELGQPLGAVLRNAEAAEIFLEGDAPDLDEVKDILRDVRLDGQRAGDVITRMRSLYGRHDVDVQPLAWVDVVSAVQAIVRHEARVRRIDIQVDTPPDLPAILGDRIHLQQVLLNLVANAMDAIDAAGADERLVTVRARATGDGFVECSVSDSGVGIDADQAVGIFEPFVTTKEKGMGMGLPISRAIVEVLGGRLWAESPPDRGATFCFTVPVCAREEQHA